MRILGKCSICGGNVMVSEHYETLLVPTCQRCGATKRSHLPVIAMDSPALSKSRLCEETKRELFEIYAESLDLPELKDVVRWS